MSEELVNKEELQEEEEIQEEDVLSEDEEIQEKAKVKDCLLYTSPSPRAATLSRMPSSA